MSELPKIPLITYNLKDRGRNYRGKERNFNIKAICDSINGPACQEQVKTRAMVGYYGHKTRVLANSLEPTEAIVVGGKYNEIEPAILTTYLEAFPDGTIKHQSEFLDTEAGHKAARLYGSRVGGFSSAIDERGNRFAGFDWVLDPNYSTNRPYTLDSVDDNDNPVELTLDQVVDAVKAEDQAFWMALADAKDAQIAMLSAALDSANVEIEHYLSMLTNEGKDTTLDSASFITPMVVSLDSAQRLQSDISAFHKQAKLPGFVEKRDSKPDDGYQDILNSFGFRHV